MTALIPTAITSALRRLLRPRTDVREAASRPGSSGGTAISEPARYARVRRIGGLTVASIGAVTLVGWLSHARTLSAVHPDFIPTAPNTALLFVLLGISLCTLGVGARQAVVLARSAIAISFLVAGARLAEYLVGVELNVDHWVFSFGSESMGLAPVGKMAFFTALAFCLACPALYGLTVMGRRRVVDDVVRALALLVLLIGMGFTLGYLYHAPLLYGGSSIPMALPTSVAFVTLGLSILVPALLGDHAQRREAERTLRLAHDELEARVTERTADLEESNEELQATVVELEERSAEADYARREAHAAEQRYRVLVEGLAVGVVLMSETGIEAANPAAERILGLPAEELRTRSQASPLLQNIHEDGTPFPPELNPTAVAFRTGEPQRNVVMGIRRPDETIVWIEVNAEPMFRPGRDAPYAVVASFADITERKRAEQELRKSEIQLRQSQKMEAIGQLAGGVAHDFNNILTAIRSFTELALDALEPEHPVRADLTEIRAAADRAAALTRQLLAFGRKQLLQPQVLDLNEVVRNIQSMLSRLIGVDVEWSISLSPQIDAVQADPGQVEQVLLNLVVNARDAMPNGGRLILETANVVLDAAYTDRHPDVMPGVYVMIAVSDTGVGMDRATRERIFEPFFTTKAPGKGTGLGLSTVYGIVKQSGGHIALHSEVGRGTTFKVYLPRHKAAVSESAAVVAPRAEQPPSEGSETILLVEDDPAVRAVASRVLGRRGYVVLEAPTPHDAVAIAERHRGPIHLVLTDLVMPELNGRDLAAQILERRPDVRVLFMSGYTDDSVIRLGLLEAGAPFISKPFELNALARKIREVLGGRAPQLLPE
jgi:two-component system, cell cycle sensor histidine kinase and response regulator CckA